MNSAQETTNRWPHRIAVLLTLMVFPLIWLGGLVTTYDAGMAVPDWPNTYNYNMFAYPIRDWFFGPWDLFVEHGHRLLASLSGLVAIALVIVTFRTESRAWIRWLSVTILAMIIFQGVLGGVRVLFDDRTFAKIHGCVGPFFFAQVTSFCVLTSRWWENRSQLNWTPGTKRIWLPKMAVVAFSLLALSYTQLVLGAFVRHIDVMAPPKAYAMLIALHLMVAVFIMIGTIVEWLATRRAVYRGRGIRSSINILFLLILAQIGLGCGTWVVKYGWPVWFDKLAFAAQFVVAEKSFWQMNLITAHVAVGSLILAFWTVHSLRCIRDIYYRDPSQTHSTD